jgi:aryl-alcohol dehydrogenase-like predicted oxidoreductase
MNDRCPIGTTAIAVSPLCLGGNVFGWTTDEEASFAVLDAYVAAGGNFIDTANIYSAWAPGHRGGESEAVIGRWCAARGNRDEVVIATKVGMRGGPDQPKGLTRDLIRTGVEASLRRLQTDHIDLYYAHEDDPDTPLAETMAAFDELVREGLVRAVAASNYSAGRLREALDTSTANGVTRYVALQPQYSLMARDEYEAALADLCQSEQISVAPYWVLARGFLSGKYRAGAPLPASPRASGIADDYMNARGWAVLDALDRVAEAHHVTVSQVALAWALAQPAVVAPIVSATSPEQLTELLGATSITLSSDELAALNAASAT